MIGRGSHNNYFTLSPFHLCHYVILPLSPIWIEKGFTMSHQAFDNLLEQLAGRSLGMAGMVQQSVATGGRGGGAAGCSDGEEGVAGGGGD